MGGYQAGYSRHFDLVLKEIERPILRLHASKCPPPLYPWTSRVDSESRDQYDGVNRPYQIRRIQDTYMQMNAVTDD